MRASNSPTRGERWWKERDPYRLIVQAVSTLESRQSYRREMNLHHLRMYGDRYVTGYGPDSYASSASTASAPPVSVNIVRSFCNAACSQFALNRPRVSYTSVGADGSTQRRARKRTLFQDGLFHRGRWNEVAGRSMLNTTIFGTGAAKILDRHGAVTYENTFPGELLTDDAEAVYGTPRTLYQCQAYDRAVLADMFGNGRGSVERDRMIRDAAPPSQNALILGRLNGYHTDQVLAIEAWHLPSSPTANDGRHAIVVSSGTLTSEDWTTPRFPFAFMHWGKDPLGFWGTGLAQELCGIQFEINALLRMVQENVRAAGALKILVERGAEIVESQITDALGGDMIDYTGRPPQFLVPNSIDPAVMKHLEFLIAKASQVSGISELSAGAQIPAGLSGSGRSMMVYSNIESRRFASIARAWEQMHVDASLLSMDAAERIYQRDGTFKIPVKRKNWLDALSYEDVRMEPDEAEIQAFPTSQLPNTPAAKLEYAAEMEAKGYWTRDEAKLCVLGDNPDTDAENTMARGAADLIDERIERILEDGELIPPNPYMDLALTYERAVMALQVAELGHEPVERIELLVSFIDQVRAMQAVGEATAAAVGGAPPPGNDVTAADVAAAADMQAVQDVGLPPTGTMN